MQKKVQSIIAVILVNFLMIFFYQKPALAQVVDSIFYNWTVYEYDDENEDEGKKCYIVSFAKNSISSHTAKRSPHLIITRFAKSRTEEISVYAGYEYKINSNAYILINQNQYKLFTDGEAAWFRNNIDDKIIIQKMLETDIIRFRSDSAIGTYAVDEYYMRGITRAYSRMKELCK